MFTDPLLSIANLLLPEVLVEYFELTNHIIKEQEEEIHFYFTENNVIPIEFKDDKLFSKGFFPEATIQDFPIRGKQYFYILREEDGSMRLQQWSQLGIGIW